MTTPSFRIPRGIVLASLLFAGSLACAPGIQVTRLRPSTFNLGTTRRVAVLQVNGGPRMSSLVLTQLQEQIVNRQFFTLINAVNRGLTIVVNSAGGQVDVASVRQAVSADVYLNANVLGHDYRITERQDTEEDHGHKHVVTYYRPQATVRVNFQVVKSTGEVIVLRDYSGEDDGYEYRNGQSPMESRDSLLEGAVRQAVQRFLYDITPQQVTEKIVLDDEDPALKPGVKLATAGDLTGAEQSWNAILAKDPNNAGAIYNIGVLLETRGDFDHAAANYQKANQLKPKSTYQDALQNLNRRLAESAALQQHI